MFLIVSNLTEEKKIRDIYKHDFQKFCPIPEKSFAKIAPVVSESNFVPEKLVKIHTSATFQAKFDFFSNVNLGRKEILRVKSFR